MLPAKGKSNKNNQQTRSKKKVDTGFTSLEFMECRVLKNAQYMHTTQKQKKLIK